jgi:hypothetical protein
LFSRLPTVWPPLSSAVDSIWRRHDDPFGLSSTGDYASATPRQ